MEDVEDIVGRRTLVMVPESDITDTVEWIVAEGGSSVAIDFDRFAREVEPRLRRSLAGCMHPDQVADAVNEAMLYAWDNRVRVLAMSEPVGYLFRVARSKSRRRKQGFIPWVGDNQIPDVEPGLPLALSKLPPKQALAIWFVKACGWSQVEAAVAMKVSPSTVSTHVERGMRRLREELGVDE